jgi:hypothetical protein
MTSQDDRLPVMSILNAPQLDLSVSTVGARKILEEFQSGKFEVQENCVTAMFPSDNIGVPYFSSTNSKICETLLSQLQKCTINSVHAYEI